ncbi:oxygen-independent coproporphyrinogen III oxidase [Ruficoccus amylovorans]|uniref:Coproporphyrinogen-III oxidase n=1 Tax=Ruficoccus amylovorans TaxID=1804625 RepID=A0A842HD37_9BACT|nr:oxygen-independent coproporphyrinogen III oxidase [Ruficoccus amylovorans]MBC2594109.1 oxygen-independent coproporphyrinogen III oxidase [Ruficoccus amylovorans]
MSTTAFPADDLIRKYNRPGPRYTSYPPATQFSPEVSREALLDEVRSGTGPLSLYLHLPFCESLCWFCGCHTITTTNNSRADAYLDDLERELALFTPLLQAGRRAGQLHFGGGTPNFLTPAQLDRLGQILRARFEFEPQAECSVELDPRRLTREHVEAFARMGVRRASFGVQDCDPQVQEAIHRVQSVGTNRQCVGFLREAGFTSLNIDLIYGLPHQSPESFKKTLDEVLALEPERFAIFNYAHVPWIKPAQKLLERAGLPSPQTKLALLRLIVETLTGAGYVYIGMDHFARADDELAVAQRAGTLQRNFQGYSTRAGLDICGFGLSSISQTAGSYRQNLKAMADYSAKLAAGELPLERGYLLSGEDRLRREVITRLMCDMGLDFTTFGERHGVCFTEKFADALAQLAPMQADGLVELGPDSLRVTPTGRFFIRNLAMCFDATLQSCENRYSKTV